MKTLFTAILLLTALTTSKAFACSCEGANFSDSDTEQAVLNFMENKLGVSENDISVVDQKERTYFIPKAVRALFGIFMIGASEEMKSCDLACAEGVNSKFIYRVNFNKENKSCFQEVKVKMTSNLTNYGYKSKVKSIMKPTCL
jgi:hypothetical protein